LRLIYAKRSSSRILSTLLLLLGHERGPHLIMKGTAAVAVCTRGTASIIPIMEKV
jgi:hypothetical protein